jgi:hypothetical protein
LISLIRLSPPRHAIRRERGGIIRHPATKVVAAPLVTASIVAMDSVDITSSPQTSAAISTSRTPAAPAPGQWDRSFVHVTQSTVTTPTTAIVAPATNTSTTATTAHLWPTTTTARPRSASRPAPVRTIRAPAAGPAGAPVPHTAHTTFLGDYAGAGNAAGIAQFAAATGTHPALASDYLDRTDGWAGMDGTGTTWLLNQWRASGYRLVIGVPIIPGGSGGTLAAGAAGAYNQYFAALAQTLVSGGAANAILRLGWEFNGTWYPWSVANDTDAQNFAAYWRQIVTTMRAVPGAQFGFLWNPNGGGSSSWNLESAYPGSAYVDYIGSDVYDEYWGGGPTPQASWANAVNQTWGLNWLVNFAARQGRAIAIPEWSVTIRNDGFGLGDDPYFITQFANWIAANNVAFTSIFSFDDTTGGQDNDITDGLFPNALAAFRASFG